jgi:phosphoglycerate dehydrogenase-like enzyme
MTVNILLWTDTPDPYAAALAPFGGRVRVQTLARAAQPSEAQRAETEVLLGWGAPPGLLATMPKLRWVQALTAGVEGWLAGLPPGVALTCARGTHGESMPENILAAIFHITKPYAAIAEAQREGRWQRRVATPLRGKVLGILGLGAIGREVARLAEALRMEVIGTRRTPGGPSTETVLARADFVLLLLPATPETESFMNAARLAQMKPGAWLLNFGRGQAIDDAALIEAVRQKRIAGAILDVFRTEPLPPAHPFWTTPNIMVLPHIGGMHPERDRVVAGLLAENMRRYLAAETLQEVVDPARGY